MKSLLAVVFVVALTQPHYAQVAEKPDVALEKDWQEYVTLLRTEESTASFFKKHAAERIKAWKEAAERREPHGQNLYARCLVQGIGVAKNESQAVAIFENVASKGDPVAMYNLGIFHANKQDWKKSNDWLRKSADKGETAAMTRLSITYCEGDGEPVDKVEAVKWAKAAAEKNDPMGMYMLGIAYSAGNGVAKDKNDGFAWLQRAAEKGQSSAMMVLGYEYEKGDGVPGHVRTVC